MTFKVSNLSEIYIRLFWGEPDIVPFGYSLDLLVADAKKHSLKITPTVKELCALNCLIFVEYKMGTEGDIETASITFPEGFEIPLKGSVFDEQGNTNISNNFIVKELSGVGVLYVDCSEKAALIRKMFKRCRQGSFWGRCFTRELT